MADAFVGMDIGVGIVVEMGNWAAVVDLTGIADGGDGVVLRSRWRQWGKRRNWKLGMGMRICLACGCHSSWLQGTVACLGHRACRCSCRGWKLQLWSASCR